MTRTTSRTSYAVRATYTTDILHSNVGRFSARYGYKQEDVVMLTDDATNARQVPTKENIVSKHHKTSRNQANFANVRWPQCSGWLTMRVPTTRSSSIVCRPPCGVEVVLRQCFRFWTRWSGANNLLHVGT
jgi:hypothetical protein